MSIVERVLDYLGQQGRALSTGDIARGIGEDQRLVGTALSKLFVKGHIQRSRSGGRSARDGDKQRRWRLPPGSPS